MSQPRRIRAPSARWLAAAALITPLQRWAALVHSVVATEPWRSNCPHCGAPVAPSSGLASLSPAARCGACRASVGPPPYTVEITTLVAVVPVVLAVSGGRWSPVAAIALAGWVVVAIPLSYIDIAVHRLPDRLTLPAAGWVLGWLGVAALTTDGGAAWVRAVAAAAVTGLGFGAVSLILGARGLGLGDAKLVLSTAALLGWLGWTALVAGLLLAFFASGLVAGLLLITRRVSRRDSLPFGPFLVTGALAAMAWVGLSH